MDPGQEDSDHKGKGDACEPGSPPNGGGGGGGDTTPQPGPGAQQQAALGSDSGSQPGSPPQPGAQEGLGERVAAPPARLLAPTGCTARPFTAGVRGTGIARVVFRLDGKRIATVTTRNRS